MEGQQQGSAWRCTSHPPRLFPHVVTGLWKALDRGLRVDRPHGARICLGRPGTHALSHFCLLRAPLPSRESLPPLPHTLPLPPSAAYPPPSHPLPCISIFRTHISTPTCMHAWMHAGPHCRAQGEPKAGRCQGAETRGGGRPGDRHELCLPHVKVPRVHPARGLEALAHG
jgi:hypothetical protein